MRLGDFMSQFDKAILEIKRLFDKSQIKEQGLALKKDGALFQAARTFYLAIVDFERREYVRMDEVNKKQDGVRAQSSPNNLVISETQKRVRAAESIARHSIDGRKIEIPVIRKPKKKQILDQKPVQIVKNPVAVNATSIKGQQNKTDKRRLPLAAATVARPKSGKPKRGRAKCIKCGGVSSPAHKCPPAPRQPTYTNVKPPAPVKPTVREKDETIRPRITPFDRGVSGTPIGATKLAGATRQDGRRAGTIHAVRFNARFKKGR